MRCLATQRQREHRVSAHQSMVLERERLRCPCPGLSALTEERTAQRCVNRISRDHFLRIATHGAFNCTTRKLLRYPPLSAKGRCRSLPVILTEFPFRPGKLLLH